MIFATDMTVIFSQKQHEGYFSGAKFFNTYCNTMLHIVDIIHHFSEMHFMQPSLYYNNENERETEDQTKIVLPNLLYPWKDWLYQHCGSDEVTFFIHFNLL